MKFVSLFFLLLFWSNQVFATRDLETIWGKITVEDPVIEKLLESPVMQRIKNIDQSGPVAYFDLMPKFSRYDHSVGVWYLLKKVGAPRKEQIAGLLHDVSHTAFSHIAEEVFQIEDDHKSYQDKIHLWFLKEMQIEKYLQNVIPISDLDPDLPQYTALEQDLPHMCADRIEYVLHTSYLLGLIDEEKLHLITNNLNFENDRWFFTDAKIAEDFAALSLDLTQDIFGSGWNRVMYHYFASAIRYAMSKDIITKEEFNFGTDLVVLKKLQNSGDPYINYILNLCSDLKNAYKISNKENHDLKITTKFRGINPLVCDNQNCRKLSKIDPDFKDRFEKIQKWCKNGYYVKLDDSNPAQSDILELSLYFKNLLHKKN